MTMSSSITCSIMWISMGESGGDGVDFLDGSCFRGFRLGEGLKDVSAKLTVTSWIPSSGCVSAWDAGGALVSWEG